MTARSAPTGKMEIRRSHNSYERVQVTMSLPVHLRDRLRKESLRNAPEGRRTNVSWEATRIIEEYYAREDQRRREERAARLEARRATRAVATPEAGPEAGPEPARADLTDRIDRAAPGPVAVPA